MTAHMRFPNRHPSLSLGFEGAGPDLHAVARPYIASPPKGPIAGNMTGVEQAGGHRWNTKDAALREPHEMRGHRIGHAPPPPDEVAGAHTG